MNVLFAAHPTVGHTSALRAIGARLRSRGHATSFALVHVRVPFASRWAEPVRAAAELPATLARDGCDVLRLPSSPLALWHAARLPRATGQAELEIALDLFTSGLEAQARQIAAHVRDRDASIVVGDYLMPSALLGARMAGRPFVALYHSALPFPAEGAPPFGTLLPESARDSAEWVEAQARLERACERFDARVATAARRLGVTFDSTRLLMRPISPDLNLLATAAELEPGLAPLTGNVLMTGPCLPSASSIDEDGQAMLDTLPRGRNIVYVSLGTVFNDKPKVFRTLVAGAAATGVCVVVSAGASFDALAGLRSGDVRIHRRVPQVPLLERVNVVITHGGNNTVQECLAAGRPMLVVPFGGDQVANAHRVMRLGVGLRASAGELTTRGVRDQLLELGEVEVTSRAQRLAQALKAYGGTDAAVAAIEQLVQASK